uniref:Uncharacterized protein n=1 Tax=Meloidogyne javanica TaxID=6303 RepID=A0A915LTT9_MELJA
MPKLAIFLLSILIFSETIECADKGKGIAGEESSGQEGGASSQRRRGGGRRGHVHIPTRESDPTQNWNEEHEGGPTEGHAQSLDDEIQNQHERLMQERLMHLQQENQMLNHIQNLTEQFNPPQELDRNLRHAAEDDVVHDANPVHYRFEGGEPQPFMAEQQMLPQLPPTGFGPITQYTGHPYHQGWPLNNFMYTLPCNWRGRELS